MIYPDTIDVAEQIVESLDAATADLAKAPEHYTENDEQRSFRLAAVAGARAYAAHLRSLIEQNQVTEVTLEQADLVATAASCAGWLGTSGAVIGRDDTAARLQQDGFFVFHPARPGEYVACYRLVAPC